ncbi:RagB/SusD family nutrient uptake outer membrane protein [Mucilaginibacter sp. HC2]|uniref:RagB/SusD family nutrient uptake outer membrane protein n=1 Tax=Mucilaginibacter inviolabilis TaxID=2714892 RepID=UPI00140CC737|nr:RagB/SusD family nutrient uptake outer membrane protein [Mucilaginibacter inviolabilis]NHA03280.1 RagB/SusD family nutrient uptake outer membrane protein [Mucilaginibacter inviolabilis]
MKSTNKSLKKIIEAIFLAIILIQFSCKKDFLDAKPNLALVVPSTITDYQALLDNNTASTLFNFNQPSLNEVGAGDFYLSYTSWQGLSTPQERNAYIWSPDLFAGQKSYDWTDGYQRILNEDIVLDGIAKVPYNSSSKTSWNNVKGTALFYRAYDFLGLVEEFAKAYDSATAKTDPGIPLRTNADITVKSVRATIQATYDQILSDLNLGKPLLPVSPLYPTRPCKAAVYGLLSRVYLSQRNYNEALLYADSSLQLSSKLLDFNQLATSNNSPIPRFSAEVIYHHQLGSYSAFNNSSPKLIVDSILYKSYNSNDLRKVVYFKTVSGIVTSKGSYSGDPSSLFGGITTSEMYLTRAECFARANNVAMAMQDLNTLLKSRWVTGTFVPYTAGNSTDALSQILAERRKELVFRGLRWEDLKRLNKDAATAVTLTRVFNGQTYSLPPNSNLYVFPIPPDEIALSGLQQNPR